MADNPDDKKEGFRILREALERAEKPVPKEGHLQPNRDKSEPHTRKARIPTAAIRMSTGQPKPIKEPKLPWYESAFWFFLSLAFGIFFTVVAAMRHDIRWLLWFSALFFIISAWILAKKWLIGLRLWMTTVVAAVLIISGITWMYVWLRPTEEKTASPSQVSMQGGNPTATPNKQEVPTIPKKLIPKKPRHSVQIEQHGDASGAVGGNVTQGPCSNLQIGGATNQQKTNCTFDTQPRSIHLKITDHAEPSLVSFRIWVDSDFPNAKFAVFCNRPCKAVKGELDWEGHRPNSGMGPEVETGTLPGVPDTERIAAFIVYHPEVLGPDVSVVGTVKSEDGLAVRIVKIAPLTISPPR